jgi:hypothetical protein
MKFTRMIDVLEARRLFSIGFARCLLMASAASVAACGSDGPAGVVSPTPISTTLAALTVADAAVVGGASTQGGVTLTAAASQGGVVVTLASENAALTLPDSVAVAAGKTSATFPIGTSAMSSEVAVRITGALGDVSQSVTVRLMPANAPATLASFVIDPNYFTGGLLTTGWVTLTGPAPAGGFNVGISSSGADGRVPDSMTIADGETSGQFLIGTGGVSNDGELRITITGGGATLWAMMRLLPGTPPPVPVPTPPIVPVTPGSQAFAYTGAAQSFVVPAGVTQVTVDVRGASGGNTGGPGGLGGRVQAAIGVAAGETLTVSVGGRGILGPGSSAFNGGAASTGDGGGGGGASDVSRGGTRLAVAGGGGGGGRPGAAAGGAGGGLTGGDGTAGGGGAGRGGTQVAGGAGGAANSTGTAGAAGGSGSGGTGGNRTGRYGGGGGGGGYFGGGGGGSGSPGGGGGGGGGSSYTVPGASAVVHTQGSNSGHGQVTITW